VLPSIQLTTAHYWVLTVLHWHFGVPNSALSWFESYLSNRTQLFILNGQFSGPVVVNCSVPQDSVLGPVKFIVYTDDVSTVFHHHWVRYHLYADDKQAYTDVPIEDVSSARCVLQHCILDVADWCSCRRLHLNATGTKTELILFGTRHLLKKATASWFWSCSPLCDLGGMLYCELSVKQHVTKVASSGFYHLRRLKQIRRLVGKKSHCTACLVIHSLSPWLLQCCVGRAATSCHRTITMSPECGSSSSAQHPAAWSRHTCVEATALVASCKQN